jgi:hypothetical protein
MDTWPEVTQLLSQHKQNGLYVKHSCMKPKIIYLNTRLLDIKF